MNNWHYRLIKQREKMHLFNQKYWGNLARKDWLVNGDRHCHYFHQTMRTRKSRSKIIKIKDASGVWIDEASQVQQLFVQDFTSRFKSTLINTALPNFELLMIVSEEDNYLLSIPIQNHEVKDAIFQMDKHKTPRSDGFGATYFQNYWHIISTDVCHAIKLFFNDGKLLKQINHMLIALIPKIDQPNSTAHFRLIKFYVIACIRSLRKY